MVPPTLRLGSRSSRLARIQVEEAQAVLKPVSPEGCRFEAIHLNSPGDRDKSTPLTSPSIPQDYFTRDLDEALRRKEIDLAIHSAKDLPAPIPTDLCLAALLPARDIRDALVFRRDWPVETPPKTVGTSSPRRADGARILYPDIEDQDIRGDVPGRLEQLDHGDYDAVIVAACALERLGLANRITEYLPADPAPQQGRLALVCRADDRNLIDSLRTLDVRRTAGLIALVGCPADPAMMPDRVRLYLDQADVVLHDRLVPDTIVASLGDRAQSVGKTGGKHAIPQSEINRRMLLEAEQGRLVVRLQGGDPGIFGHLGEELAFLNDWNIRVDVIPALSAAQVAAARARAALTHRHQGRSVSFVSGHSAEDREATPFPGPDGGNLAVYMGVRNRVEVQQRLTDAGWAPTSPVLVGQRIGYEDEQTFPCTLDQLPMVEIDAPAVFLVGMTSSAISATTLFVGTHPEHFLNHGPLLHWPMIRLEPEPLPIRTAALDQDLASVDGILFPSRYAVPAMVEALLVTGDIRRLAGKSLLAVGPTTTRELGRYGLKPDLAAASLRGVRDLAEHLTDSLRGRYLYPCSNAAPRERRAAFLAEFGIELVPRVFYTNRPTPARPLPRQPFGRVLFTSSSTVRTYFERYPEERKADRVWLAVGPSTLETLVDLGLEADLLRSSSPARP